MTWKIDRPWSIRHRERQNSIDCVESHVLGARYPALRAANDAARDGRRLGQQPGRVDLDDAVARLADQRRRGGTRRLLQDIFVISRDGGFAIEHFDDPWRKPSQI